MALCTVEVLAHVVQKFAEAEVRHHVRRVELDRLPVMPLCTVIVLAHELQKKAEVAVRQRVLHGDASGQTSQVFFFSAAREWTTDATQQPAVLWRSASVASCLVTRI